jgi:hypothetical protein
MQITLEIVRGTLRKALGWESFVARFISSVKEDKLLPTVCITKDGTLSYNPKFLDEHVKTESDLFCVVFHEILHPLFNHFIYKCGELENIGADAMINSVISRLYAEASDRGRFFARLYPGAGIHGLLRPDSNLSASRYGDLYSRIYYAGSERFSTGDVIQTLKILTESSREPVILIGSHWLEDGIPAGIVEKIAGELKSGLNGNGAGYNSSLSEMFVEILNSKFTLRRQLLQKYVSSMARSKLKSFMGNDSERSSPILVPGAKMRRASVLIACGVYPMHYKIPRSSLKSNRGVVIYLDVSGSVMNSLPDIIGIIKTFSHQIGKVYAFSNTVKEMPLNDVLEGRINTTYGTDFDCVADSIAENCYDKVIVFTDGYADLKEESAERLRKLKPSILTILFEGAKRCDEFEPYGEVVQLNDVKENR